MIFLGSSQTFFGVLASLLVLCLVLDKSNFLYNILDEIQVRINEEIEKLNTAIDSIDFNVVDKILKKRSDYKLLGRYIQELKTKTQADPSFIPQLNEALCLDMKIRTTFGQLKSKYSGEFLKPAKDLMDDIHKAKEQIIAPLYALLCCLIIFICDELLAGKPEFCDFIVTFLTVFFSISVLFWIMIWKTFFRDIRIEDNSQTTKPKQDYIMKFMRWKYVLVVCPLFYGLCLYLSSFIPFAELKWGVAFGIGLFLPVGIIAYLKVRSHHEFGVYTYEFGFNHFIGLLFFSLLIATVTEGLCAWIDMCSATCLLYQDVSAIKMAMLSMILLSGLLFPFLMPYLGFLCVLKLVKEKVKSSQSSISNKLDSLKKELETFCDNNISE